jgi:hypothetical protein
VSIRSLTDYFGGRLLPRRPRAVRYFALGMAEVAGGEKALPRGR